VERRLLAPRAKGKLRIVIASRHAKTCGYGALLLLLSAGCSHFQRTSECRSLASRVNQAFEAIDAATRPDTAGAAEYRAAAERYRALSAELDGVAFKTGELEEEVRPYRDVLVRAGELAEAAARELGTNPDAGAARKKLGAIRRELGTLRERQRLTSRRIEAACRG
jgi:hypothetical protein